MAENSKIEFRYAKRSANHVGVSTEEWLRLRGAGQKWCCRCRQWHPETEFGADAGNRDGLLNFCRKSTHRLVKSPRKGSGHKGKTHSLETKFKMSTNRSGVGNANWRGGITPAVRRMRQNADYQRWRRQVIARDNHSCSVCGASPKTIHAHHVKPIKTHPELALDPSNGVALCPPCHRQVHREGTAI